MKDFETRIKANLMGIKELVVDFNGYTFEIIYGEHIKGWFVAIPNFEICTRISEPEDDWHNANRIRKRINIDGAPEVIANSIKENWREQHVKMQNL